MSNEERSELYWELESFRESGSKEDLKSALRKHAKVFIKEGNFGRALDLYCELKDKVGIKSVAKRSLDAGSLIESARSFAYLRDESGLLKVIEKCSQHEDDYSLINLVLQYDEILNKRISSNFVEFYREKNFEDVPSFLGSGLVNTIGNIANNYDFGVGVAKGGLYPSYISSLFDLPILISESHRKGVGATFVWKDLPKKIKNKKILIMDKDVLSGRTLKRVVRELGEFSPKSMDLFLVYGPKNTYGSSIFSNFDNITKEINQVYHPKSFGYQNFSKIYEILKRKVKND